MNMAGDEEIFRKVAERVAMIVGASSAGVTSDTEVYRDLGLHGLDLLELELWAQKEFGVAPDLAISDYGPPEACGFMGMVRWLIGRKKQYKSLKVRDVMDAIEAKRWFAKDGG
jgi:hypothetical protein